MNKTNNFQYTTEQYEDKIRSQILHQINRALEELPAFVKNYDIFLSETKTPRTRAYYLQDLRLFTNYLASRDENNRFFSKYVTASCYDGIDQEQILSFFHFLDAEKGISASGKKRKLASLRCFSAWLIQQGYDGFPEVSFLETPKQKRVHIPELTSKHAEQMIAAVQKSYAEAKAAAHISTEDDLPLKRILKREHLFMRDLALMTLITKTTLRLSEIIALNTDDITKDMNLKIWRKNIYVDYPLTQEIKDILHQYLYSSGAREYLSANSQNEKALFIGNTHARITTYSVQRMVKTYADTLFGPNAGITAVSFRLYNGSVLDLDKKSLASHMGYASTDVAKKIFHT